MEKFSRLITYEEIYNKLEEYLNMYMSNQSEEEILKFIKNARMVNVHFLDNRLIPIPKDMKHLKRDITKEYLKRNNVKGEIGTIDGDAQIKGIINLVLLILMINKTSKIMEIEGNETMKKKAYAEKQAFLETLIANLYVYNLDMKNDKDFFAYGAGIDYYSRDSFIIDIPKLGQFGFHYKYNQGIVRRNIVNKVDSILERKKELGQISKEELQEEQAKINKDTIIPKYKGLFNEYIIGFPMETTNETYDELARILNIDNHEDTQLTEVQLEQGKDINKREVYYAAIKLGWGKYKLFRLAESLNNTKQQNRTSLISLDALMDIGDSCIKATRATERRAVDDTVKANMEIDRKRPRKPEFKKEYKQR